MTDQPTFEYHDEDGDDLSVRPMRGIPAVLILTGTNGIAVDLDRVEEVIAGIRDAARTAAGQADTEPVTEPQDHPAAELYVLLRKAGEDRDTAQELIYAHARMAVRQHTALNDGAPAVGQPAEAQAATESPVDSTAAIEMWARLLNAADAHVLEGRHPAWHQLAAVDQGHYRKVAKWLMGRAIVPPKTIRAKVLLEAADALDESETLRDLTDDHMHDINAAANELRRMAEEARS